MYHVCIGSKMNTSKTRNIRFLHQGSKPLFVIIPVVVVLGVIVTIIAMNTKSPSIKSGNTPEQGFTDHKTTSSNQHASGNTSPAAKGDGKGSSTTATTTTPAANTGKTDSQPAGQGGSGGTGATSSTGGSGNTSGSGGSTGTGGTGNTGGSTGTGGTNGSGYPAFPTSTSTGVPSGTNLKPWPSSQYRTDAVAPTSTESIDGITWSVYDGFNIVVPSGNEMYVPSGNILFRNSRFTGNATPSNTGSLVQVNGANWIWLDKSEIDANGYSRGVESDNAHVKVTNSKFIDTSDSAVEKNDSSASTDMIVSNNYIEVGCAWTEHDPHAHADGIQWGAARNVTIYNNTVLTKFVNGSCVSNSTIGGWAELGNVNTATIEHNRLAGGGGR